MERSLLKKWLWGVILVTCCFIYPCHTALAQSLEGRINQTIRQMRSNRITLGVQGSLPDMDHCFGYCGEDVNFAGTPAGVVYIEYKGASNRAGFQKLRFESAIQNLQQSIVLNAEGATDTGTVAARNPMQAFSTEIAPLQEFPDLIVSYNVKELYSRLSINSSGYNFESFSGAQAPLGTLTNYLVQFRYDELLYSYYFKVFSSSLKLSYFDLVYFRPQLSGTTIQTPRMWLKGYSLELLGVPFTFLGRYRIIADIGLKNSISLTRKTNSSYFEEPSSIKPVGGYLNIDFDWRSSWHVTFNTQIWKFSDTVVDTVSALSIAWSF